MPLNPLVENQYSEWVYPEPIEDVAVWAETHAQICDPSLHHALIWPERAYDPAISILVAGCGTSQAAILAYTNPQAKVVGFDLSARSLEHAEMLKAKHKLANLELRKMDLHEAASLGQFDLVYATGVLHHLPDPRAGLAALAAAAKENGVLCLMLYAKYARFGVYMLQDAFRRMGLQQNPSDVAITREIIGALPKGHPARLYVQGAARDLSYDGGIVDMFLHRQDRAFSVPEILELAKNSGLAFQTWTDNLDYYPDGTLGPGHPAAHKIAALAEEEQWAVTELLAPWVGFHSFLLRKPGVDKNWRVDFSRADFSRWIPIKRYLLAVEDKNRTVTLSRAGDKTELDGFERDLFLAIDNRSDCATIAKKCMRQNEQDKARRFFERMWKLGHVIFTLPQS